MTKKKHKAKQQQKKENTANLLAKTDTRTYIFVTNLGKSASKRDGEREVVFVAHTAKSITLLTALAAAAAVAERSKN